MCWLIGALGFCVLEAITGMLWVHYGEGWWKNRRFRRLPPDDVFGGIR